MKLLYSLTFFFLIIVASPGTFCASSGSNKMVQLPGQFYMVLYIESVDTDKIQAFISELQTLPNKIISVTHNSSTHEFTIVFTELIRNDTIYQIVLRYFDDFKEVDGYYYY